MAKKKLPIHITPIGTASYPFLNRPDTKFKEEGEYHVKLIVPEHEAEDIVEKLTEATDEHMKVVKAELKEKNKNAKIKKLKPHYAFEDEVDDDGNETGNKIIGVFKMRAHVTPKEGDPWDQKPNLFDAKKQPLAEGSKIGSGTKMRVAYQMIPFYTPASDSAGISLRLQACQIIDLVEYGTGDADSYGFGEEEGFSGEGEDPVTEFDGDDDSDGGDEDDF